MTLFDRVQSTARRSAQWLDWRKSPTAFAVFVVMAVFLVFAGMSALSSTYLNPQVKAPAPYEGQLADGEIQVPVFVRAEPLDLKTPSTYLMHGRLGKLQAEDEAPVGTALWALFGLAAVTGLMLVFFRHWLLRWVFLGSASALSLFWAIRVSAGWDEYFINLKHAFNLVHHLRFSANFHSHLEATVDVVPFATAALLSKLFAMNLADAGLAVSLLGNVVAIVTAYFLARRLARGAELPAAAAALLVAVTPLMVNVAGTGFMSGLFAGLVLLAAYWCVGLRGRWSFRGFVLLGLLTLFRTEAVLLAGLVWLGFSLKLVVFAIRSGARGALWVRAGRRVAVLAAAAFTPFVLSVVGRLVIFHEVVPTPVIFKNSGGNPFYIRGGINYLLDCLRTFRLDVLFAVAGVLIVRHILSLGSRASLFAASVLVFTLAYATGGGDWFPATWARYAAPLIVLSLVLTVTALHQFSRSAPKRWRTAAFVALAAVLGVVLYGEGGDRNAYRDMLADWKASTNRWQRVDRLATYGDFLRKTTPESAVVASPEDATLMYHAERDMVDLLGIANPTIARTPADPLVPGDLMHRRRNLDVLKKTQPEIVALYEMSYLDKFDVHSPDQIRGFLQDNPFSAFQTDRAFYRVGSFAYLQSLGYRPIAVATPTRLFFYWVHVNFWAEHVRRVQALGLTPLAVVRESYKYSKQVTDRFYGGLPYVATDVTEKAPAQASAAEAALASNDPSWSPDGAPKAYMPPTPPAVGKIYASWSNADSNTGVVKFAPLSIDKDRQVLVVPLLRGPVGDRQTLTVRDGSGAVVSQKTLQLDAQHKWYWLTMDFKRYDLHGSSLSLEMADNGDKWGEWSAIGTPRVVARPAPTTK